MRLASLPLLLLIHYLAPLARAAMPAGIGLLKEIGSMIVHNSIRGIALMIIAMVFLPIKDGMAKILGGTYSPLEIIWAQFCLVYLILAPVIILRYGPRMLWPRPLGLQVLRGIFAVTGIGFF